MFDIEVKELFEGVILLIVLFSGGYKTFREYFKNNSYKNSHNMKTIANFNQSIYEKMVELKAEFQADRIMLFRFHNGDCFVGDTNNLIIKMSCTHETVKIGVEKIMTSYQSILVSKHPNFLKNLVNNDFLNYEDLSDINDEDSFAYEMKHNGNESLYIHKIISNKASILGFVIVGYSHLNKKPVHDFQYFEEKIESISYLVNKI